MRERDDPRVPLLRELAEPLRLSVIDQLFNKGSATVTELATHLDVPMPQLSNHLRRLREAGLVKVERHGRHGVYELADSSLEALVPLLDRLTGRIADEPARPITDFGRSRLCYDHLAGRLGVGVYRALRERDALIDRPDGTVELGARAGEAFAALGIDVDGLDPGRRRFAFECFDSTEHAPHLAGALGDAVVEGLIDKRWLERDDGSRIVRLTPAGARGLRRVLDLEVA